MYTQNNSEVVNIIIDNLTATNVYFEKKIPITITCDNIKNNSGIIKQDDLGNLLVSIIDSGDTNLYRLKQYNGEDSVLLYNENDHKLRLVESGDIIDMPLDFTKGTRYFVGAKKVFGVYSGNYTFTTEISDYEIFKIFLDNGREIKTYTVEDNIINITGIDRMYIDDFSELIIYVYKYNTTNNIVTKEGVKDFSFVLEYYGYEAIWDVEEFISGEYFETFTGQEVICFDSLEVSQSVTKDSEKSNFSNSPKSRINSVDNSVELNIFNASEIMDLIQYIGSEEFRMVLVNSIFGRVVLINNCQINNGVSLIFEKERNVKRFTLTCGNYIDVNLSNPLAYGKGRYGRGLYGNGTQIWNSARRGG